MAQLFRKAIELPIDILNQIYVKSYYRNGLRCPDIRIDDLRDERTLILASRIDMETKGLGGSLLKSKDFKSSKALIYIGDENQNLDQEYRREIKGKLAGVYGLDQVEEIKGSSPGAVGELLDYLRDFKPQRIYAPFILSGDRSQLRVINILLRALGQYDKDFSNIWMYEAASPSDLRIINRLVRLTRQDLVDKNQIFQNFSHKGQASFEVYGFLDRSRASLLEEGQAYGAETFIRLSYQAAIDAQKILNDKGFEPDHIYGYTSKLDLLASFLKNRSRRVIYNNNLNYALKARFIESREENYGL